MRLLIGFITAFCLLVYLAFMANDTSYSPDFDSSLGQDRTNKKMSEKGLTSLGRTPASTSGDEVTGQQKQEELLKRQSGTNSSISKREGHSERPYENTDDDYDRSLNERSNNYESLSANSARSPVRTSNAPKRGFSRPPSSSPNSTTQGNGNSEGLNDTGSGTGETIITGGGFDDSSESQGDESGNTDSNDETTSSSSASGGGGTLLSCQASQQGGMFSNPLSVKLSCNATADIRYCLSSTSTCCDPDGPDSQVYDPAEEVLMGMENTDYCLSYYGDSNDLSQSTQIESYTYSFNSDFPELNVEFTKRWVQSTQINERAEFTSNDFGKADHLLGQINYLTHDISDPAFDESCYDMAMNNMGLNSPSPTEPLELFDVSGLSSADQDLYYSPDNLDYIENNLLSYIVNDTFDVPLISCQISTVTLEDFHITDSAPHLVSTSASGQIQGQFTPYGFFEETLPTRSPAGESNNEVDGRELRTNFLSILYQ